MHRAGSFLLQAFRAALAGASEIGFGAAPCGALSLSDGAGWSEEFRCGSGLWVTF